MVTKPCHVIRLKIKLFFGVKGKPRTIKLNISHDNEPNKSQFGGGGVGCWEEINSCVNAKVNSEQI